MSLWIYPVLGTSLPNSPEHPHRSEGNSPWTSRARMGSVAQGASATAQEVPANPWQFRGAMLDPFRVTGTRRCPPRNYTGWWLGHPSEKY